MSNEFHENENARYECDHNDIGVSNIRLYREIKASLVRQKNQLIDDLMGENGNIADILQETAEIVNGYERMRLMFKHYIFEGKIPIEFFADEKDDDSEEGEAEEVDDDDDIPEVDNMWNHPVVDSAN